MLTPKTAPIHVQSKLEEAFNEERRNLLIAKLKESYSAVAEKHDESEGFNSVTFGTNIYQVNIFKLDELTVTHPQDFARLYVPHVFRLRVGGYSLGSYRVGNSSNSDIRSSFPSSNGAVKSMVVQSFLPGLEEPDLAAANQVILAHMGNPRDLLCAAHLCIPTALSDNDHISEWGYAWEIYRADISHIEKDTNVLAPNEDIARAVVRRKNRKKAGESQ